MFARTWKCGLMENKKSAFQLKKELPKILNFELNSFVLKTNLKRVLKFFIK